MSTDVLTTFEALLEGMNREKERLADTLRDVILQGRFEEAQRLLTATQGIERIAQAVRTLRDEWRSLERMPASYHAAYDTVSYAKEQRTEGRPTLEDKEAPELRVAEGIFGRRPRSRRGPRMPLSKTPYREFRLPILEALEQLGGKGQAKEVLSIVYEKMEHRLTENDLKPTPSGAGGEIQWRNATRWERNTMIKEGLLRADSPYGVWEMSDTGREYLERMRREDKGEGSA